ncbi:MAG: DUF4364 family protein [Ruminococcaceae bacterium]|nr:DUF4364 family protein [Oscillospiraceae bacterium]
MLFSDEFDALAEGIEPGGLRNKADIKVLICYLLKNVDAKISREQIGNIIQDQRIANYFETMDAISDLLQNGNITETVENEKEYLEITDLGRNAVSLVGKDLPKTIREKALKTAVRFVTLDRNERENDVKISPVEDGYSISFSMTDGNTKLMELKMFVPDGAQAQALKDNFIEDPVRVYSTILASLMVD